jgi:hypothetical protein
VLDGGVLQHLPQPIIQHSPTATAADAAAAAAVAAAADADAAAAITFESINIR